MIANDFISTAFIANHWKRYVRIAQKILSTSEYRQWFNRGAKKRDLIKYWVAKEAAYKLTHALGIQDRWFLPKSMNCKWNDLNYLEVEHGNTTYFGQLQSSDRGLLAWVSKDSQIEGVRHLWEPFKTGEKQQVRERLNVQWIQSSPNQHTLPVILGRDSLKTTSTGAFACRTYSSPWAVMSVVKDPS